MGVKGKRGLLPYSTKYFDLSISVKQVLAEFTAMTIFVFVGCGTAVFFSRISESSFVSQNSGGTAAGQSVDLYGQQKQLVLSLQTNGNWGIVTALSFVSYSLALVKMREVLMMCVGMAIMYLVYTFGHISGGQINCAGALDLAYREVRAQKQQTAWTNNRVTWGLVLSGNLGVMQGIANFIGQLVGSLLGAGLLYGVVPEPSQSSLGANSVGPGFTYGQAVLGEIVMTFVLVFVVHMTATWPQSIAKNLAPFAIGMVVFTAHCVLLPVDGCSINPTRSFGPAIISNTYRGFWVFWVGPLAGATLAVPAYWIFRVPYDTVPVDDDYNDPEVEFRKHKPVDGENGVSV